jgi:hypothetical protein
LSFEGIFLKTAGDNQDNSWRQTFYWQVKAKTSARKTKYKPTPIERGLKRETFVSLDGWLRKLS